MTQSKSSSPASNIRFHVLAGLVIIAAAAALAAAWPVAAQISRNQAANLIGEAGTANLAEASANYQLATWLDSANPAGYVGLARTQILAGHAEAALTTLNRAGEGSEAASLRLRTLMELGRTNQAADRAAALVAPGHTDADILLAGLAYARAGRQADIPALLPLVSSPEAAQRLSRAAAATLPLAAELYASGLPESSRTLLMTLPASFERNLLLAQILFDRHTDADLKSASDYLTAAVAINPSNLAAHRLLATVYADRGLAPASSAQTALVAKLQSGKP